MHHLALGVWALVVTAPMAALRVAPADSCREYRQLPGQLSAAAMSALALQFAGSIFQKLTDLATLVTFVFKNRHCNFKRIRQLSREIHQNLLFGSSAGAQAYMSDGGLSGDSRLVPIMLPARIVLLR
jgi:hypothetical protein